MHDYYSETKKEDQEKYLNLALGKLPEDDQVLVSALLLREPVYG